MKSERESLPTLEKSKRFFQRDRKGGGATYVFHSFDLLNDVINGDFIIKDDHGDD